ncbi:DUF5994 family protein [Streptomyces sp. NPDC087844]|uniref:DUF5994 family protein n=1 Tax=Streptomyces sp. NPDC087844 TaxID=3365805 RepID=UPI0037FAF3B8
MRLPRPWCGVEALEAERHAGALRAWGHISGVTVNGATWTETPGRMLVLNQVVRLHRTTVVSAPHTICPLAPGRGRWDLLVVPPDSPPDDAGLLMAVGAAGHA